MTDSKSSQELLNDLSNDPQLKDLESHITKFNIFEALGSVRQELRHSDFLAFLLNPYEKHGFQDALLKEFLHDVIEGSDDKWVNLSYDSLDLSNAIVDRERWNIDILVSDPVSKIVCLIENKIYSGEHSNQLQRYLDRVNAYFIDYRIIPVYLTPDGIPPEDENSPYIPISYEQIANLISNLLLAEKIVANNEVRTMMQHYVTMIRRHIVAEPEIYELCRQIYQKHKAAIDLIIEHRPDMKQDITDFAEKLVDQQSELVKIRTAKSYINMVLPEWRNTEELNVGTGGWSGDKTTISVQISNWLPDNLGIHVVLSPVDDGFEYARECIYEHARSNPAIFKGCDKNRRTWLILYRKPLILRGEFETLTLEEIEQEVERGWQSFLDDELPTINKSLLSIQFVNSDG